MNKTTAPNKKEVFYVADSQWPDDAPEVLVICCSDGRFRDAVHELLIRSMGTPHHDLIAVPGGPATIVTSSLTFTAHREQVKMFYEERKLKRIILIAHGNICAYYKRKYRGMERDPAAMRVKQESDLWAARAEIAKLAPGVPVELYYVYVEQTGGQIRFERLG